MKHVYVASPYSHKDKGVMYERSEKCLKFVAEWYNTQPNEYVMYSPIAYMAPAERAYGLPGTWEFWSKIDLSIIDRVDELWVLVLAGLKDSTGVRAEVNHAQKRGKTVKLIWPNEIGYMIEDLTSVYCQIYDWEWHDN